jgi:heme-degrading monooxygenase HmoA
VPTDKGQELMPLFQRLRTLAMNQPGYISGETLKRIDSLGEYVVISTWQSIDNWYGWVDSKERSEIQQQIDFLLQEEPYYEIYAHA